MSTFLSKIESKERTYRAKQARDMTEPLTSMLVSGKENSSLYYLKRNIPLYNEQYLRFTEF